MSEKNKPLEQQFYTPPPKVGKWEGFKTFLWNSETSQFLGRTGSSWGKILLFYIVFYSGLAGFFAAMLAVFHQTLDDNMPKWQGDASLIGSNPGLGFRPMPPDSNVESTLIWYKGEDKENIKHWVDSLDTFLQGYTQQKIKFDNVDICDYDRPPSSGKVCQVDLQALLPCVSDQKYNYPKKGPCIFLKLNKIYGWTPAFYNDTTKLAEKMPKELKEYIVNEKKNDPRKLNTIWVTCEGENPADVENVGPINYLPYRGFPGYYFPYLNTKGYLSPIVAVNFERPTTGILINIECKAWAQNIHHDRAEQRGSVHFELMID